MKIRKIKTLAACFAACCGAAALPAGAVTIAQGDLLIGFRATGGTGADTSYVINVGQAANYRDASVAFTTVATVGTDLAAIYGPNWASRTDLFWGAVGVSNTNAAWNGDVEDTVYATKSQNSLITVPSPYNIASPTNLGTAANNAWSMMGIGVTGGFDDASSTYNSNALANSNAAAENNSDANSWRSWMATGGTALGSSTLDFKSFSNIEATPDNLLALYRISNDNGGQGTYEGSLALAGNGAITFIPEPSSSLLAVLGTSILFIRRRSNS